MVSYNETSPKYSLTNPVSAMTEAGLNTINLSTLNTWQQVMLFLLIIIGSAIFVSAFVVQVRLRAFEDRFVDEIDRERRLRRRKTFDPMVRSWSRTRSRGRPFSRKSSTTTPLEDIPATSVHNGQLVAQRQDESTRGRAAVANSDAPIAASATERQTGMDVLKDRRLAKPEAQDHDARSPTLHGQSSDAVDDELAIQSMSGLDISTSNRDRISFAPDTRFARGALGSPQSDEFGHNVIHHLLPFSGVGARPLTQSRSRSQVSHTVVEARPRSANMPLGTGEEKFHHRFLKTGVLSRNSTFHHMDEKDRERLGGLEYKSVKLLAWLVPVYLVAWQLLGAIGLGAWVAYNRPATAAMNGLNPWWVGAFNAISAFNNSGMSLLDANMVAFQTSIYLLVSMSLFILAGNTCYPIFLRLIVWTMWKLIPDSSGKLAEFKCVLRFLLDHPRRVYTNLFPSRETWWLFGVVVVLNGIDCAFFSILNIGNRAITYLNPGFEFLDGLFQAFAVRSGGFYVVPIPSTRISLQILYVVMMYISVYPVVITMRNSNVYEERSLGIYAGDPGYDDYERQHKQRWRHISVLATLLGHGSSGRPHKPPASLSSPTAPRRPSTASASIHNVPPGESDGGNGRWSQRTYFVQQQLRAQLAHDLWWLVLAIWLIMIIEGGSFEANPAAFSVFNVIFEVVSGYATVGISVGVPNDAYSFSGSWHKLSKLILCAVMLRGRHRGLPVAIDKAIMLPRDGREQAHWEEEDARLRFQRARSMSRPDLDDVA